MKQSVECTAFVGGKKISSGPLREVVAKVYKARNGEVLIFEDATGELIDVDFRGSLKEVLARIDGDFVKEAAPETEEARGPGRPKLGVVAREVTLLPRHWEWLSVQPGGASVALRKLVDEARRVHKNTDRVRRAREAAYRFMSAMAGDEPGFEEATRGLFAGDPMRFAEHGCNWPPDVREYAAKLAAGAFEGSSK